MRARNRQPKPTSALGKTWKPKVAASSRGDKPACMKLDDLESVLKKSRNYDEQLSCDAEGGSNSPEATKVGSSRSTAQCGERRNLVLTISITSL